MPSEQSGQDGKRKRKVSGRVFPEGNDYEICVRDCSEAVRHSDGALFCRLYCARLTMSTEPIACCKVAQGLIVPRQHDRSVKKEEEAKRW